jgi:hypothetical protein
VFRRLDLLRRQAQVRPVGPVKYWEEFIFFFVWVSYMRMVGVRLPVGSTDFSLLHSLHPDSEAQGAEGSFPGRGVKLTTHLSQERWNELNTGTAFYSACVVLT